MIVKTAAHLHSAVAVLGVIMVIEVYRYVAMCRDPISRAVHEYRDVGPLHLVAERLGAQRSLRSHVAEWKVVPGRLRGRSQVSQSHLRPAGRFKRSCVVPIRTGETDT